MRLRYTEKAERLLVIAALLGALTLAIAYNVGPIFEGPDETQHYQTVRVLKYERTLPDPLVRYYRPLSTATNHHAPLYYILASAVLMLVDDSDYVDQGQDNLNPFFMHAMGIPGNDNKNSILHERATRFPGSSLGYVQGVHLVRLFSGILGVATVYAAYRIYRILWPQNPGARLMALGLTAFWPQFNYMGGVINNDNLLFLTGTLTLLLLLTGHRPRRCGADQSQRALSGDSGRCDPAAGMAHVALRAPDRRSGAAHRWLVVRA
jgi:hypothetical protein